MADKHVIFGTGPLGKAVMRELIEQGQSVTMVNRSGQADVPADVRVVKTDASNVDQTRSVCAGAQVVYHCLGAAYSTWAEVLPGMMSGVLAGATAAGARLVYADNVYAYGHVSGPITADLPETATTRKGSLRAHIAQMLREAHNRGDVQASIGRGSDFFGPGVLVSALGERVFPPALQGKAAMTVGNPDQPHTYTYINDFGKALVLLGQRDEAQGHTWLVPNPDTLTTRQVITMIFEQLNHPPRINSAGTLLFRAMGLFNPDMREMVEMMYEFEQPFVIDSSVYSQTFAHSATPLHEALRQTIEWYRTRETGR